VKLTELDKLERQKAIIRQQRDNPNDKPQKQLQAVSVKEWDKPAKLLSLCEDCISTINEPTRVMPRGKSATRRCDWCEVKNVI
jgi:lipoate synthase